MFADFLIIPWRTSAISVSHLSFCEGGMKGGLSTSTHSYQPAYVTTMGYGYATGIGSVNAFNLAMSWPNSRLRCYPLKAAQGLEPVLRPRLIASRHRLRRCSRYRPQAT